MKVFRRKKVKGATKGTRRTSASSTSPRRGAWLILLPCLSIVLACNALTLAPPASHADSHTALTETREGRLAVFDDVWETVRDRYYDPSFHGLDWQAQRETFRPLAAEATDAAELY